MAMLNEVRFQACLSFLYISLLRNFGLGKIWIDFHTGIDLEHGNRRILCCALVYFRLNHCQLHDMFILSHVNKVKFENH